MKIIGYWGIDKSGYSDEALKWTKDDIKYPSPSDFVDENWVKYYPSEYASVRQFLLGNVKSKNLEVRKVAYRGFSKCRVCGCPNGSEEYIVAWNKKGIYTIPSGYLHYLESHSVKPPQDFIDFCVNLYV